uniref:Uncharacterized protein n=1 Tax=Tanacetum cinerariifolium TaxID=118510 RepID=A0A6L2NTN4_TANCI|nr:hypothetical protein [Tanacetum cinerariifolium]
MSKNVETIENVIEDESHFITKVVDNDLGALAMFTKHFWWRRINGFRWCEEVRGVEKMSSMGSKLMVRGDKCLEGCVGASKGEVSGGGMKFGVSKSLLGEIPEVVISEGGGEKFRDDGGAIWRIRHFLVEANKALLLIEAKQHHTNKQQPKKFIKPLLQLDCTIGHNQIAQKEEAGIELNSEKFDFMAAAGAYDDIEEVIMNFTLKDNLQQALTSGTQTNSDFVYDSDGSAKSLKICRYAVSGDVRYDVLGEFP